MIYGLYICLIRNEPQTGQKILDEYLNHMNRMRNKEIKKEMNFTELFADNTCALLVDANSV